MFGRNLALLGGFLLAIASGGCKTDAYCFLCGEGFGGGSSEGGSSNGGSTSSGGSLVIGGSSMMTEAGAGGEGGVVDPEPQCDTQEDPLNCGQCGNVCEFQNAFPKCVAGECVLDYCFPGFIDDNEIVEDGCEKGCVETNDGEELCDSIDNDCDGEVDEDFDLTTVDRCGDCNTVCNLSHATPSCEEVAADEYRCRVDDCEDEYIDDDGVHENGCEYHCPVWPTAAESCNGLDDNCDGEIDEGAPGAGQPCDDVCPEGDCQGICTPGETVCVGTGLVCVVADTTVGPTLEVCDALGLDEDCDGVANGDDGFDFDSDVNNCSGCGIVCDDLPNTKVERCDMGVCEVDVCDSGWANHSEGSVAGDEGCEYQCPVNPPTTEVCDDVDNDCDGLVDDEDDSMVDAPAFCLQLGPCDGAVAECISGEWLCNYADLPNGDKIELNPAVGYAGPEQSCDGFDNNCDGRLDEGLGVYQSCTMAADCGSGTCNQGRCTCTNDGHCQSGHECASDLFCRPSCFSGFGICERSGTVSCDPGDADEIVCDAVDSPTDAEAETCNGIDDNCDGNVDERNPEPGTLCYDAVPGGAACPALIDQMVQVGSVWMYKYEASRPDADDGSAGITDDARSCSGPDRLPWTYVNWGAAGDACALVEDSLGNPMHLCEEDDWEAACEAGNDPTDTLTLWSYASSPGTHAANVCNDRRECAVDGDCSSDVCTDGFCECADDGECDRDEVCGEDGYCTGVPWAGGSGAQCYANGAGSNDIYDLSGNVAEWTSTSVEVDETTYYRVRGGSFTSFGAATACNFDFVLSKPEFANADVGFRCCSDAAP
jgi:hypothetical protein